MSSESGKNISFYPCAGRREYSRIMKLSPEERKQQRLPFRKISTRTLSLNDVFDYITDERNKAVTEEIRSCVNNDVRRLCKSYLCDFVVFAGVPERRIEKREDGTEYTSQRKRANFTKNAVFSSLITIDLDHLSEQGIDLAELREALRQDSEIGLRLMFVSPSGDGLKLICKSRRGFDSPQTYRREYDALANYLQKKYRKAYSSFEVDESGKDICRSCFLCYDADAVICPAITEFDSEKYPAPVVERNVPERKYSGLYFEDDGIEDLVRRVEAAGIDIAPTYREYFPLVCSFSSLGERGREYLHRVCSLSPKYSPDDTDFDFENNVPDEKQDIGYFVNLCKANGIDVKREKKLKFEDYRQLSERNREIMDNAPKQAENSQKSNYAKYLETPTRESLKERVSRKKEGIETPYKFGETNTGQTDNLTLRSGAITMICGKTSHGKSKFLQNLALGIARQAKEDESVLYFTLEEEPTEVTLQIANVAVGERLSRYTTKNIDQIRRYYQTGNYLHIPTEAKDIFGERISSFESLLFGGRLRILYPDTAASPELVEIVRYLCSQMKVKAVFIDYVQLLYNGTKGRRDRKDEIADVCDDLLKLAIEEDIPLVVAAQLNRLAENPAQMSEDNIADSSDLSKYANTIVCLWNSTKSEVSKFDNEARSKLEKRGFTLGKAGKIYAKLSKNRGGTPNIDAVFDFDGASGVIAPNDDMPEEIAKPKNLILEY